MVRILIATGIFHPEPGGPATYLHHLLPELQQRGHHIHVLTFGDASETGYTYPVTRISRQQGYLRRQWAYFQAAQELLSTHDLVFAHSLNIPLPAKAHPRVLKIVGDSAWERAVNKGWVPPDTDIDDFQEQRYGLRVELNRMQRARFARRADHVIVPSRYLKRMVAGWGVGARRITVIYNATRERIAAPHESQQAARRVLELPSKQSLLFTPARLTRWKGIEESMRALADHRDVHLLVAGDGPQRETLESLRAVLGLGARVTFVGRVPRQQMPSFYQAADYTLLYSGYEGLSHTLLESLSVGTPVIASDKGGNPEVVLHGQNGLLVPYKDIHALSAMIEQAFQRDVRAELASGTTITLDKFVWSRLVDQTAEVLGSAVVGR